MEEVERSGLGLGLGLGWTLIPIFTSEKYEFWSIKMKTLFMSQGLWDLVEYGFVDLTNPDEEVAKSLKETKKKDAKVVR
ncbi:hypothetical protein NMG60_11016742 [Bertholletia excelsa]